MCMTKAEWSGWMQAIGTFAAILFAIALPFLQSKYRRAKSYAMARHCLLQLLATYSAMQAAIDSQTSAKAVVSASKANVDSLFKAFDGINAAELPASTLPSWWSARANANHLKDMQGYGGPDDEIVAILRFYETTARNCFDDFVAKEPRVWGIRFSRVLG